MEPRFLLDTNVCIYIRQNQPPEVLRRFKKLRPGEAAISVITFGELLYGAKKSVQSAAALDGFATLSIFCQRCRCRKQRPTPTVRFAPIWRPRAK